MVGSTWGSLLIGLDVRRTLCVVAVVVLTNLVVVFPVNFSFEVPFDVDCRTAGPVRRICLFRLARFGLATGAPEAGVVPDDDPVVLAITVLGTVFPSTTTTEIKKIVLVT